MKKKIIILILLLLAVPALDFTAHANASQPVRVISKPAVSKTGKLSNEWINAISGRNSPEELEKIKAGLSPLTEQETQWLNFICRVIPGWEKQLASVTAPFAPIRLPRNIYILFGNRGGNDGFTYKDDTICVDLSHWVRIYGNPTEDVLNNESRTRRILSHEYTHLLTKLYVKKHPVKLGTPVERALFTMWYEGLGNYYSLSAKWFTPDRRLSKMAGEVLNKLAPVFVDRLIKLSKTRDEAEENELMKGLSKGPFRKKWGALTLALWLMKDTRCNNLKLKKWIEAGPGGVLVLADKYLPGHLKEKLHRDGNGL